jgi:hypothetical protein
MIFIDCIFYKMIIVPLHKHYAMQIFYKMMIVYFTRTDNRKYSAIRLTNHINLNQIASIMNTTISPNSKACCIHIHQSENKSSIQAEIPSLLFDSTEN